MNLTRVLLIEDDQAIRRGVCDALAAAGFAVTPAETGERGLALLSRAANYDLVLLDVVLPGRDGMYVLSAIREQRPSLPVIMLTALGSVEDRVRGLRLGADDYVVKPFNVAELLARVEAVLRRSPDRNQDAPELELDHCVVNLQRREIRFPDGRSIELSEKEHELLRYLAANPGRVVSRDELIERVW
ncbi:MAG: response regulator transcription factor, partial [Planctomycetes bacterium]|nr:response regulator transcription factor [Planctomycetota bacterium]